MNDGNVNLTKVTPTAAMKGEDEEDCKLLGAMLARATEYLTSFQWCTGIIESYLGIGIGGVVAVFLFRFKPASTEIDEWVWVIVGDLPAAYITTEGNPNPACALDAYTEEIYKWVEAAAVGKPVDNLIPVNVEPTFENAKGLRSRLDFLHREILSKYVDDLKECPGLL